MYHSVLAKSSKIKIQNLYITLYPKFIKIFSFILYYLSKTPKNALIFLLILQTFAIETKNDALYTDFSLNASISNSSDKSNAYNIFETNSNTLQEKASISATNDFSSELSSNSENPTESLTAKSSTSDFVPTTTLEETCKFNLKCGALY